MGKSERLSILWLCRRVPLPLDAGDRVYSYRLMEAAARIADVTSCSILPEGVDPTALPTSIEWHAIDTPEIGTVRSLLSPLPLVSARSSPPAVVAALRDLLERRRFDVVVFDYYASGWAFNEVRRSAHSGKILYIAHNHEARLSSDIANDFTGNPIRGYLLKRNAEKIARLERKVVRNSDLIVCLTDADRLVFEAETSHNVSYLILPPGYSGPRVPERVITEETPRHAVMLGSVRWTAKQMNVASFLRAADDKFHRAGVTIDIIGDVDEGFRDHWEPRLKATRFRGFVDDVAMEMAKARIGLMIEATGGGFKLKLQDYVFHRVPVAALSRSYEGLPPAVSDTFIVEDGMNSLTDRILIEIDDIDGLNTRQSQAYEEAKGLFDWDANARMLIESIADRRVAA